MDMSSYAIVQQGPLCYNTPANSITAGGFMTLDLTSLTQSITTLRESVEDNVHNGSAFSPLQQETFRSGIIQYLEIAGKLERCFNGIRLTLPCGHVGLPYRTGTF